MEEDNDLTDRLVVSADLGTEGGQPAKRMKKKKKKVKKQKQEPLPMEEVVLQEEVEQINHQIIE